MTLRIFLTSFDICVCLWDFLRMYKASELLRERSSTNETENCCSKYDILFFALSCYHFRSWDYLASEWILDNFSCKNWNSKYMDIETYPYIQMFKCIPYHQPSPLRHYHLFLLRFHFDPKPFVLENRKRSSELRKNESLCTKVVPISENINLASLWRGMFNHAGVENVASFLPHSSSFISLGMSKYAPTAGLF